MNSNRGFAIALVLPYLLVPLVLAAGYQAYRALQPGRNKAKADQVAAAAVDTHAQAVAVDAQANAVKDAVAAAAAAHKAEVDTHVAIETNAAGFVEASTEALKSDPAPSQAVTVALGLNDAAAKSLGVQLTPAQLKMWNDVVSGLLRKNAEAEAKVAKLEADAVVTRASLDAVTAHAKAADSNAASLSGQLSANTATLAQTSAKAASLAVENKQWADGAMTLWGRIKALGWLAVILATIAFLIGVKLIGVQATLTDSVALLEHVKACAVAAGHDAVQLEEKIHAWWGGAKGEQTVANIKDKVLRL